MDDKIDWEEVGKIVKNEINTLKKETSIIWDGKQFTVRIPKKFAEVMNIDQEKDVFEFALNPLGDKGDGEAKTFELIGRVRKNA